MRDLKDYYSRVLKYGDKFLFEVLWIRDSLTFSQ